MTEVSNTGSNGNSRKIALLVMSLLVISIVIGTLYFLRMAIIHDDGILLNQAMQFFEAIGLLILGAFISVARELFQVGKNEPNVFFVNGSGELEKVRVKE